MPPPNWPKLITEAGLASPSPVQAAGTFILDDATNGVLDTSMLGDDVTWADLSTWARSGSVTRAAAREQGPLWSYQPGTASVVLRDDDGRFDPGNAGGPYAVAASPAIRVGANLSQSDLGVGSYAAAVTAWTALTSLPVPVTRIYKGASAFAYNFSDVTALAPICLSLQPAYNPVSPADLASMEAMLQQMQADGADVQVTLWHEPFFSGLTNTQYKGMVAYYGPTVRKYYPLWVVFSGDDTDPANGYYPGDGAVDGVAVDAYAGPGSSGVSNAEATVLQAMGIADSGGKPFAVWEFGAGFDLGIDPPPQAQSHANVTSYFQWLTDLFTTRVADGLPCGDLLFFSSHGGATGSYNFLGTGLSAGGGAEGGTGNWASGSGTIGTSTAQAHSGTTSFTITAPGGGGTANIVSCTLGNILTQGLACNPGDLAAGSGWFRAQATPRSSTVRLEFTDSSGVSLSTVTGTAANDSTSTWGTTTWTVSATAPASTARVRLVAAVASTVAGEVHYFDDPQLGILPASNDLTSPIQYNWDYRVALLQTLSAALNGTGAIPGEPGLRAMIPLRQRAVWGGTSYPLFSGFTDADADDGRNYAGRYAEVTLSATDGQKPLSGLTLPAAAAAGAGETTGARVNRILDAAGWYTGTGKRDVGTGDSTVQATTFGDTAWSLLLAAADAEIGELYVDGSGQLTFRGRHAILTDARSATVQAVFGDRPGTVQADGTELPYATVTRSRDDATLANDIQATRVGGALQQAQDAASIAKYLFPRSYARSDLILTDDATALSWAQWVLHVAASDDDRFDQLTLLPLRDPVNLWPQALGREVGDRVQVWRRPPGVASPVVKDCFIRGISHAWDVSAGTWVTTWTLQDASRYGSFLTLDSATSGVLGSSALAF